MAPKVIKQTPEQKSQAITDAKKKAEDAASQLINFSLKYLDISHDKFPCFEHDKDYYKGGMVARIKDLCSMKKIEFTSNRSSALRMHPIKWTDTTEKSGFGIPGEEQLVDTPYQFSLSSKESGRIHGFFILIDMSIRRNNEGDYPIKGGDAPIKGGDAPIKRKIALIKGGDYPVKGGDDPIK